MRMMRFCAAVAFDVAGDVVYWLSRFCPHAGGWRLSCMIAGAALWERSLAILEALQEEAV